MVFTLFGKGRLALMAMTTGLGISVVSVSSSFAQEATCTCPIHRLKNSMVKKKPAESPKSAVGFQGFGLGYHLGYGYGGSALGVGSEGGYPFYGGPGYPHPAPTLSRMLPIVPFCYFGGPGFPTPDHPYFFGNTGELVGDHPVVTFETDPSLPIQEAGYGQFSGSLPYPESTFAPFATMIGEYGTVSAMSPSNTRLNTAPPASGALGMLFEPFAEPGRTPGLRVTSIVPASVVQKAGLQVGDVILSINGYVTQKLTDPEWIILNASPDQVLKMNVQSNGKERELKAQLP